MIALVMTERGLAVQNRVFHRVIDRANMEQAPEYPQAIEPSRVGTFPASAKAGGGYVWDAVLEYRVWCHPEHGAPDEADGGDYFHAFADCAEALAFSQRTTGAEAPLALILQNEYIDEPEPGQYVHVKAERITEWPVAFLRRPRRTERTIPDFLSPDAPANRLDILRGLAK
jgi:putative acetyltransferase